MAGLPAARRPGADVTDVRWMLEELRVSLFAQALGTQAPVSENRILAALSRLLTGERRRSRDEPVNAVLVPPQAARFASVTGADLGPARAERDRVEQAGPARLDRVFLFPRSATGVEWFERELAAYRALARTRLGIVPRLLGRWEDPGIYPFPFAAVTRLRGEVPAAPEALVEQLGRAIARWHELEPPPLPGARPPRHHDAAHHRWLRRALDPATSAGAAAEAADRLGRPAARRPGRTCWPAPRGMIRSWFTATSTRTSFWPTATG